MKLLLAGLLTALVLISELVGMVVLARYSASTEAHPPEQGSFTVVSAQGDDDGKYRWVEWEGSSSCGVWEVRREVESGVNPPESEGGGVIGEEGDCEGVRTRPHLATTRRPGVDSPTGSHRPDPTTSENSASSRHLGE
jgi:hypothetical protein